MIMITDGNIFESNLDAVVNPVNLCGVMGAGLALKYKNKYPDMFEMYQTFCRKHVLKIGTLYTYKTKHTAKPDYIINLPTKRHYSELSKMDYIKKGIDALKIRIEELSLKSIAIPALGCGCGGLNFNFVSEMIISEFTFSNSILVKLYKPYNVKKDRRENNKKNLLPFRGK